MALSLTGGRNKKNEKGFTLAEVLTISVVFTIVMIVSLSILLRGWKVISRMEVSIAQVRSAREALMWANMALRETDEVAELYSQRIVFKKNNANLQSPVKEVWELSFDGNKKLLFLNKYSSEYPNKKEIVESKIAGRGIENINFAVVSDPYGGPAKLIRVSVKSVYANPKIQVPEVNLSTKIKMK